MKNPISPISMNPIPPGSWAAGVSGGADSVALLLLLTKQPDISLCVVHLDHELRGAASTADAEFVRQLADRLHLPFVSARRSEIEAGLADLPANPSAKYRAIRLELFRRVVVERKLAGVILAHHKDDVAETVLQRLIRGSVADGLTGIAGDKTIGGLRILRPMLRAGRRELRDMLRAIGQEWREDASNASDDYLRNRLRKILETRPELVQSLLDLADACRAMHDWSDQESPVFPPTFDVRTLERLPPILARAAARRWLIDAGSPPEDLTADVLDRLVTMATDAATPSRQHFPGGLIVRRRAGKIDAAK
ncbi:MAG TPA: tRNA lysidine(34) synthetase TilS [Tepidisphaeraceae bacterium]|nr:tRNA lysidine(34) synthetase TilS [Tepidisphaeraceae bacterium]